MSEVPLSDHPCEKLEADFIAMSKAFAESQARIAELQLTNKQQSYWIGELDKMLDRDRNRIERFKEAMSMGSFHHPSCPYYQSKDCCCARKKVTKALEESEGMR